MSVRVFTPDNAHITASITLSSVTLSRKGFTIFHSAVNTHGHFWDAAVHEMVVSIQHTQATQLIAHHHTS